MTLVLCLFFQLMQTKRFFLSFLLILSSLCFPYSMLFLLLFFRKLSLRTGNAARHGFTCLTLAALRILMCCFFCYCLHSFMEAQLIPVLYDRSKNVSFRVEANAPFSYECVIPASLFFLLNGQCFRSYSI